MLEDMALEKSRRWAWANYYRTRSALEETIMQLGDERLRRAEIAVYVEMLNPPAGHPVWTEIHAAYEAVGPADLEHVRRFVRYRIGQAVPSAVVLEAASA